jgi:hypothetical protein
MNQGLSPPKVHGVHSNATDCCTSSQSPLGPLLWRNRRTTCSGRGDPEAEAKHWLEKLSEADEERRGFLRLAAKGRITDEELDEELATLEETRRTAERELNALREQKERLEQMERDRDAVLEYYASLAPEALDSLTSEERHQLYKMLRLKVWVAKSGDLEIEMAGVPVGVDSLAPDGSSTSEVTSRSALMDAP